VCADDLAGRDCEGTRRDHQLVLRDDHPRARIVIAAGKKYCSPERFINGRLKGHMNDGAADVVQNTFLQLTWSNRPLHSLHNPAAYFRRAAARKNP